MKPISYNEIVAFGQGNVHALTQSGKIFAEGVQSLTKQVNAGVQAQVEEVFVNAKAFIEVKSVQEAVNLQVNIARNAVEKNLAEAGSLANASIDLAERAAQPLVARFAAAAETFARAA